MHGIDSLKRERTAERPQPGLIAQLDALPDPSERKAAVAPEPPATSPAAPPDPLPRPGTAYKACARMSAQMQPTLFLVGKNYMPDGFAYANLERVWMLAPDKPGGSPVLMLRFAGSVVTEIRIEGRQMSALCNAIGMHVMPWIWEHPSPHDFTDESEPLIRKISLSDPNVDDTSSGGGEGKKGPPFGRTK